MESSIKIRLTPVCDVAVDASNCEQQKVTKCCLIYRAAILPFTDIQIMCREFEFGGA
jgi:hypothetical protein